MNLSPHFELSEFTSSQTALRRGIDNTPNLKARMALQLLCVKVLEPVREHFRRPVVISSGYRSPALNRAIGGSTKSQHSKGEAADFEIPGVANFDVAQWMMRNLNYDQLILEFYTPGDPNSGWIHVSFCEPYRNQELTAVRCDGGKVDYLAGLFA
ncbi:MAG: hypothetical protein B7Y88_14235 [Sphingomonadales bacterium 32-64-17]|nr:MAG: hypothetical protein B7Y88_14235 [Sphingomonadales bacterium 32-64-17]